MSEAKLRTVAIDVCELCLAAQGQSCATPGCLFWMCPVPEFPRDPERVRELALDAEEAAAMEATGLLVRTINDWGLVANQVEFTAAIHTLQFFIVLRMLNRVVPGEWSAWFEEPS